LIGPFGLGSNRRNIAAVFFELNFAENVLSLNCLKQPMPVSLVSGRKMVSPGGRLLAKPDQKEVKL
jgi:hypothetical protein